MIFQILNQPFIPRINPEANIILNGRLTSLPQGEEEDKDIPSLPCLSSVLIKVFAFVLMGNVIL
jgi:hypothetical protein